jgi:ABC-2 type transport system permease protein
MSVSRVLLIGWTNLVRLVRDRIGLFFIFVLPVVIIVALGLQFGGGFQPRLGAVTAGAGDLGDALLASLEAQEPDGWAVERFASEADLTDAVERALVDVGIVMPDGYDANLRAGRDVTLRIIAPEGEAALVQRGAIESAIADQAAVVRAARFAAEGAGIPPDQGYEIATTLSAALPPITGEIRTVGEQLFPPQLSGFGLGAHSQLVLFMFVTSLTGAAQLILSRQLGVSRRMLSTPTSIASILVGEATGRFAIAMVQGLFIVIGSALAFGVAWGDPLAAGAIVVLFALVGAGAAMLVGAVSNNAEQASSVGVFVGLGLAALGGGMAPPEIFPDIMQTISRLTPHRWAIDALREVVAGAGVANVLPQLGVLAGFAVVLLALATWRLRVALTA